MHSGRFGSAMSWPANSTQLAARAKRRIERLIFVSIGVVVFRDDSGATISHGAGAFESVRTERRAAGFGAGKRKHRGARERAGRASLKLCGQHGAIPRLLFLLAKTLRGVFR
ncbi:hypothetical protein D3C76_1320160 [compost metagenome]